MTEGTHTKVPALDFATFLRKFEQRAKGVVWLLGAGASRASGIKTAGDMIWDFKSRLYRSAKRVPLSAISDLGDAATRRKLQDYFDQEGSFPAAGSEEEYSHYFEATYPEAQDRRTYIDELMTGARPSYGHLVLAHLMKRDLCRMVWTTNFDRVLEDAVAQVFDTNSAMVVGDLGEPSKIKTAVTQNRWPVCGKLHGDFHSEALKNTSAELARQDQEMRQLLLDSLRTNGLAVAGYSGRDQSVLSVLDDAINNGAGFPNGLFWFVRQQDSIFDGVTNLIERARSLGIDANLVRAESFDELCSDVIRYLPATEDVAVSLGEASKVGPRKIDISNRSPSKPFLRTNAIPIIEFPRTCRLVDCEIGGAKEIQELLSEKESNLVASRVKKGVLVFGDDGEVKRVFAERSIREFDTLGILDDRVAFESGERSLLRQALFLALSSYSGLELQQRGPRNYFRADRGSFTFDSRELESATGRLSGKVSNTDVPWTEACGLRLDFRLGRLWLLLNPYVVTDLPEDATQEDVAAVKEFVRERRVKRYNQQSNRILDAWVKVMFGNSKDIVELRVEGGAGIGASGSCG